MKIAFYDPYLDTMGGGEHVLAALAETLEGLFPHARVDLLVHKVPQVTVGDISERFGACLARTQIVVVDTPRPALWSHLAPIELPRRMTYDRGISRISERYDLFLNNCIFSTAPNRARYGVYICMFPLAPGSPRPGATSFQRLRTLNRAWRARYFNNMARTYHQIWANSEYTRGWINRFWGVDSAVVYPPVAIGPEPVIHGREKIILTVGRFFVGAHNKKHDVMLSAFKELCREGLDGWHLHLVGGRHRDAATRDYTQKLQDDARGFPVTFHFDASERELSSLQDRASIFWHATGYSEDETAHPDKFEHFGMSTVEAMAHGIVPIVIESGGQTEIVEEGISGFRWRDLATLKRRTLEVAAHTDLRVNIARRARERATRFSRAGFVAHVRTLFSDLAPSAHAQGKTLNQGAR